MKSTMDSAAPAVAAVKVPTAKAAQEPGPENRQDSVPGPEALPEPKSKSQPDFTSDIVTQEDFFTSDVMPQEDFTSDVLTEPEATIQELATDADMWGSEPKPKRLSCMRPPRYFKLSGAAEVRYGKLVMQGVSKEAAVLLCKETWDTLEKMGYYYDGKTPGSHKVGRQKKEKNKLPKTGSDQSPSPTIQKPLNKDESHHKRDTVDAVEATYIIISILPSGYPQVLLTAEEKKTVENAVLKQILVSTERPKKLQFRGIQYKRGFITVSCVDAETAAWLMKIVPELDCCSYPLKAIDKKNSPEVSTLCGKFRNCQTDDNETILGLLQQQNNALEPEGWKIIDRQDLKGNILLKISMGGSSYRKVKANKFVINFRFGGVTLFESEEITAPLTTRRSPQPQGKKQSGPRPVRPERQEPRRPSIAPKGQSNPCDRSDIRHPPVQPIKDNRRSSPPMLALLHRNEGRSEMPNPRRERESANDRPARRSDSKRQERTDAGRDANYGFERGNETAHIRPGTGRGRSDEFSPTRANKRMRTEPSPLMPDMRRHVRQEQGRAPPQGPRIRMDPSQEPSMRMDRRGPPQEPSMRMDRGAPPQERFMMMDRGGPPQERSMMMDRGAPLQERIMMMDRGAPPQERFMMMDEGDPFQGRSMMLDRGAPLQERSMTLDRGAPLQERSMMLDRGAPPQERFMMMDRGAPLQERSMMLDRGAPLQERSMMMDRGAPLQERSMMMDRGAPLQERSMMMDRGAPQGLIMRMEREARPNMMIGGDVPQGWPNTGTEDRIFSPPNMMVGGSQFPNIMMEPMLNTNGGGCPPQWTMVPPEGGFSERPDMMAQGGGFSERPVMMAQGGGIPQLPSLMAQRGGIPQLPSLMPEGEAPYPASNGGAQRRMVREPSPEIFSRRPDRRRYPERPPQRMERADSPPCYGRRTERRRSPGWPDERMDEEPSAGWPESRKKRNKRRN